MKGLSLEKSLEDGKYPLPKEGFDGGICPPPRKPCKGVEELLALKLGFRNVWGRTSWDMWHAHSQHPK
jgi:hypothetical protein